MWTARFGRGFGPVVRQTTELMNEYLDYLPIISKPQFIRGIKVNKYGYKKIYQLYNNTVGVLSYMAPNGRKINE